MNTKVGILSRALLLLIGAIGFVAGQSPVVALPQSGDTPCRPAGSLARLAEVPEASGLAVSRKVAGRLWAHNDSGAPVLFALDTNGSLTGRVRLTGLTIDDWEAIAVGPCAAGSCIYVADIGDNAAKRNRVTIYRLPEPDGVEGSAAVTDVFHATYPDGPQDAEAILIGGDGRVHLVAKGETGPIALYRFPGQPQAGAAVRLERVGDPMPAKPEAASHITDGSVSPDGQWVALRTKSSLTFYRASELFAGQWRPARHIELKSLKEPQGEGVALGADNIVFLAGEGGGGRMPGTFGRLDCGVGGP